MTQELSNFFKAINFNTDKFNDVRVEKVVLNKTDDSFKVHLKSPVIIDKEELDNLYQASLNGLNNKKCIIIMNYDKLNKEDIIKYLDLYIDSLIKKRPSFSILKTYTIEINDINISILIDNKLSNEEIKKEEILISEYLKYYGLGEYKVSINYNEENKKSLEEVILESKNVEYKAEDSNIILGSHKDGNVTALSNIFGETKNVIMEVFVFDIEISERKGQKGTVYILNLKISDYTDSYLAKMVRFEENDFYKVAKKLKKGNWYRIHGNIELDQYLKQLVVSLRNIESIKTKDVKITDDEEHKRIEFHAHSKMSQMDGVVDAVSLVKFASSLGHKAVAITDHNNLQSYPNIFNSLWDINNGKEGDDRFKVLYGVEMNVVDADAKLVYNEEKYHLLEDEFIVFDVETTGFNAGTDQLIEIGAVKIKNGEVVDRFDELIACPRKLPQVIVDLTMITDEMLKDKDSEENVTKRFLEFAGNTPLIAHNAGFDISFIEAAVSKFNLSEFKNTVIDTMALARTMYPDWHNHKLSTLVRNLKVEWDESKHHRADYDSEGTASCFYKMVKILEESEVFYTTDLKNLVDRENIVKFAYPFHLTLIATNAIGLKNLFKIVSTANTKYLFKGKEPKIPRDELINLKEGLLIGSGCVNGEVFSKGYKLDDDELRTMMSFYDYIEVYPPNVVSHLINKEGNFHSISDYEGYVKRLISVAKSIDKPVIATGDVHNLRPEDLISRKIIVSQKTGGKLHPLNRKGMEIPNQYFLTTKEMLDAFNFLDEETKKDIVINNPEKIASKVEYLEIIKSKLYTPLMENSGELTRKMVYDKAHELYGDPLPKIVAERIEAELEGIIGGGFDVIYLISQKLVKKSNEDGYFVGSRGSVGSSIVATFMGITEVNGLSPHYLCPKCKHSIFEDEDGKSFGESYSSGYDLPDKDCSCGTKYKKEGQDMPFATFLGFKAEKVPDIDLNFSGDNQADAHNYVKELFGETNAYRAGTISTVADKTAFGFVKAYCEEKGIILNSIETERLSKGVTGIKRTTGQHPGGIIVIPQNMDVFDFTAFQYPADEPDSTWYTTHFDFHAIHDNVLKLDILGHDDPTMLKYLGDTTKVDIEKITFDDENVLSLFNRTDALKVTEDAIMCPTGTLGIPEFGTNFVIRMLQEIKPTKFSDLVKISGLSHGTDVWQGNVRDLIVNDIASFDKVVGCRDDIMVLLINYGMEPAAAFKISEFVRKGKATKEPDKWVEFADQMRRVDTPEWFIESCRRIKYMFPKAHACAYVMMAYRVAYFKVYYPLYYYSAYFSIRRSDFDVVAMIKGKEGIRRKIAEVKEKGFGATAKEQAVADTLNVALEMMERGFSFKNISLEESKAKTFVINEEDKCLVLPFMAVEGLGDSVAYKIEEEREVKPFYCIEDFASRGKVNQTTIGKLRDLGVFDGLPESAQMSLF